MNDPYDTPPEIAAGHLRAAARQSDDAATRELRERIAPLMTGYELGPRLGRGGMGVVFRARQSHLDRDVAVKVLLPPPGETTGWGERFQREARALAKLSHPGIVTVHDFGEADGLAWIVMEAVEGTSLRELLSGEALTPAEALSIAPGICSALQYAHEHGIVHRDIKPENVLIDTAGHVKLVDFGLAKLAGGDVGVPLTRTEQAMGTLRYMAPEQLDAPQTVDHRADIFSLGVVLYEMLTGQVPQGVIAPPSQRVEVDVRVDEVVLRSLEREPERRYQQVSEVGDRVESIRREPLEERVAMPELTTEQAFTRARRTGLWLDAGVLLLFVLQFATIGVACARAFDELDIFLLLGAALFVTLGAPLAFALLVPPARARTLLPFVRIGSSFASFVVAGVWGYAVVSRYGYSAQAAGQLQRFYWTIVLVMLLPFLTASLSALSPGGLRFGRTTQETLRWAGVAACAVALAGALSPWTVSYSVPQLLFCLLVAAVGAVAVRGVAPWPPARVASGRAILFAAAGLAGYVLVHLSETFGGAIIQENRPQVALLSTGALALIGALAGAGSPDGLVTPSSERDS